MAGYNRIIMIGNLTRDPEYRQLPSGQGVCQLGIASNRQYRNKQTGAMVQEVCFIDIDVFGPQAESCKKYLQKGRSVLVEGRLKLDTWETPEGQKRSKHGIIADRVVFLSSAESDTETSERSEDTINTGGEMGQEFFGARQPVKKAAPVAKKPKGVGGFGQVDGEMSMSGAGEITLQDEPPFQDDLPF